MAPSVTLGFLIEGRTLATLLATADLPTALAISAERARPSRWRRSLMNFSSDCWYLLQAMNPPTASTRNTTPTPTSQPVTPAAVAVHPVSVAPNTAGSWVQRKDTVASMFSGLVGAPQWMRPARKPAPR